MHYSTRIRLNSSSLVAAVAVLGVALQAVLSMHLAVLAPAWTPSAEERPVKWDPALFKTLAFGHWPAGIDWLWIKTLVDPSISHVPPGTHPTIYYDLDLATELDPAFFDIYVGGANLLAVIRDDAPGALALLLKADRFRVNDLPSYPESFRRDYWSGAWDIPLLLAYVYLFELNDMTHAAAQFKEAARLPGAPAYLGRLAQRFEKPGGEYEVGLKLLRFMISSSKDLRAQEKLESQFSSLVVAQYLFQLNLSFESYLGAHPGGPQRNWKRFLDEAANSVRKDPFGGELTLAPSGKLVTSTPHEKVFGLE